MRIRYLLCIAALAMVLTGLADTADAFPFGKRHKGIRGSGDLETRELDLDTFTELELGGAFDINVTIGDEQKVEVTIDDNLWDNLVTDVRRGTLELDWDENCRPDDDCEVNIVVTELEAMTIKGAGDVAITDFRGERFEFDLYGAGDLVMDGEVDELAINISGAGDIDTRDLIAREVDVTISGAGNAEVHVTESLEGRVSGVGNLTYYGDPEHKRTRVSGIGNIRQR